MSAADILSCAYGYEVATADDRMLQTAEKAGLHLGQAARPASRLFKLQCRKRFHVFLAFLVNILPWLNIFPAWFPGASWKKVVKEWRDELRRTIELPYEYTVNQIVSSVKPTYRKALMWFQRHKGLLLPQLSGQC